MNKGIVLFVLFASSILSGCVIVSKKKLVQGLKDVAVIAYEQGYADALDGEGTIEDLKKRLGDVK